MSSENLIKRYIFPNQPSQAVILDLNTDLSILRNCCKALHDVVSLTVSISGPCRIPYFGLIALSKNESFFPLKSLKDHYEELINFLNNFETYNYSFHNQQLDNGTMLKSLYTFMKQLNENDIQDIMQINNRKLEFTILTSSINLVLKECREFCRNSCIKNVQKITIIVPKSNSNVTTLPDIKTSDDEIFVEEGIIEVIKLISNHSVMFEDVFKNWLIDNSLENHHIDIIMRLQPNVLIVIKCDVQECMINPSTLPQAALLMLESDYSVSRTISYASNNRLKSVPIYQMEAISQVSLDGICDSLTFGNPLLIKPTMCWRLDIEDITQSQIYFQELYNQLSENNNGMILRRFSDKVTSYYLLIPANNYLILKCLTPKELIMPRRELSTIITNHSKLAQCQITDFLTNIQYFDEYNPIYHESGVYHANIPANRKNKRTSNSISK